MITAERMEEARSLAVRLRRGKATKAEAAGMIEELVQGLVDRLDAAPRAVAMSLPPVLRPLQDAGEADERAVLGAVRMLAAREPPGTLLVVRSVRAETVPALNKARFDEAALRLFHAGRVVLHHHDHPMGMSAGERERLVFEPRTGLHYVGIAPREVVKASVQAPAETLEAFARRVVAAARTARTGRFGEHKVFLSHVHRAIGGDLEAFKARAIEAHRAGLLTLSRADLVEAMPAADVRASEALYLGEQFHFVRLEPEARRW